MAETKKQDKRKLYDDQVILATLRKHEGKFGGLTKAHKELQERPDYRHIAYITVALKASQNGISFRKKAAA